MDLGAERALMVVTHDPRIFSFAGRIARIDDGRIQEVLDSPGTQDLGPQNY